MPESLPALLLPAVMLAPDPLLSVFLYFCFGTIEIAVEWVYFEAGKSIEKIATKNIQNKNS